MKKSKLIIITKILAIVAICLISFVGIYVQKTNRMENIVKDYNLSKDLEGYRQIIFDVSKATIVQDTEGKAIGDTDYYDDDTIEANEYKKTDIKVNLDDVLKTENYEKSKEVLENRLKEFGVNDYNLSLDKETGRMYLQVQETSQTDRIISNVKELGTFEIKDSEDGTVYISNEHLKGVKTLYNTTDSGTIVYLEIDLNEEGTEILKNLSENDYATLPEEIDESEETESTESTESTEDTEKANSEETDENSSEKPVQKEITLAISGNEILTTSFGEPIVDGTLDLSMNAATTDNQTISETLQSTSAMEVLLNSGSLPIKYKSSSQYVATDISAEVIKNVIITISIVFVIALVFMVIKHKSRGLLSAISFLGFAALYLLIIRYTNVVISFEGITGIVIALLLNYVFSMKLLKVKPGNSSLYKQEYIDFIVKIIPVAIISIVFSFVGVLVLNSLGMALFWGILLMLIYNVLITRKITD